MMMHISRLAKHHCHFPLRLFHRHLVGLLQGKIPSYYFGNFSNSRNIYQQASEVKYGNRCYLLTGRDFSMTERQMDWNTFRQRAKCRSCQSSAENTGIACPCDRRFLKLNKGLPGPKHYKVTYFKDRILCLSLPPDSAWHLSVLQGALVESRMTPYYYTHRTSLVITVYMLYSGAQLDWD